MSTDAVSSPLSTGGAGTFFERDVAAYWLAQLLLHWIPPILIDANVVEVSFQTEHLGWKTDDLLITCEGAGRVRPKLAAQVKRTFTVSASNEECQKAILDFWQDVRNPSRFSVEHDRLVLIVQRGTDVLLRQFGRLLDCARASRDGADFDHRLATPGFISKKAAHYAGEISKIVGEQEGRIVSTAEIWAFLKVLYLLSLDLDTATRQAEGHIRGALAYTAAGRDAHKTAATSWSALQRLAESSMKEARTFRREDLKELKSAHGSHGTAEDKILKALREHSEPILRKIRSTLGATFHLPRAALVEQVLDQLEDSQVVIISGAAGSGKSAVGKEVLNRLSKDHFAFAFRVEEFAKAHIDETLQAAQVPGNAVALAAALAAQGRKLILIDSMERLLETSSRDAFSDLITRVVEDPDLRLVITCRDYSTEQVRESFLREPGLKQALVLAPPLDDSELDEIAVGLPQLARPLSHPPLRRILRNPYFLDKALEIPWPIERPLPESERAFRRYFWQHVVCVDRDGTRVLGRRREQLLEEIAIRRARALSEYIPLADLDAAVVASLKADSLVISSEGESSLIATAHDVLEDWAILEWLEERHLADSISFAELAAVIGTHPAIRRSYRKWVSEILEREPTAADRLFLAATADGQVSAQFRDDTLVSILRAPLATELLARHETALVANDCALLKRVIHLLRVSSVAIPEWARGLRKQGSALNVPEGPAWPTVLKIAYDNWQRFSQADQPLLLGLIEDAVRGVAWWAPEAPGEPFVAGIAYALLPALRGWRSDDARERLLKVIAKIPKADAARFETALRGTPSEDERERDRVAEELRDLLLTGMEGMPAVRDLPELMVSVASDYLLATEEELRRDTYRYHSTDIDIFFGIRGGHRHDFFPASALRGPWWPLLQLHPGIALKFYHQVFNHSIDWYVHPRLPDRLEPAWQIELAFPDGTVHKQWVNPRLWTAYRGLSVSPYVLQSMLMALEKWLLEVATRQPEQLDKVLLSILRRSQSAALSAVVASVAIAHPNLTGEALLVLLSAPDYVRLDRQRMAQESQTSALANMLPQLQADKMVYDNERKQSNALPHRGHDLEFAVSNLQFGPLRARVHALLDQHTAALPEPEARSREDLLWELSLKRMDLREYTLGEPITVPSADGESSGEPVKTYVPLELKPLGAAVQALVDEGTASQETMNKSLSPWMWAIRVLKGEATPEQQTSWREHLTQARSADRDTDDEMGTRNGPGCVTAVCVRDHWSELTPEERTWCIDVVCSEILRTANRWTDMERIQRHDMAADRRCAGVVAGLLIKVSSDTGRSQVRAALAAALTHPNQEVSWFAAWSVDARVWAADRALALRCANTIALHAESIEERWEHREHREWTPAEAETLFRTLAEEMRDAFKQPGGIPEDAYATVNLEARAGGDAYARILTILAAAPADPASASAFERASLALVQQWDEQRKNRGRERRRDFDSEFAMKKRIQEFALRAPLEHAARVLRPIVEAVDQHADEIDSIVHGLTIEEDRSSNPAQYWDLWELFATAVKRASWLKWLDREHPTGYKLLSALFMTRGWKDTVRHWKTLEGEAHRVDALFEALPRTAIVLDDYLRFLYQIGGNSLPQAFTRIVGALKQGDAAKMLALSNSVFLLEVLLQRHVYGRPLELKRDRAVRDAVLNLLDVLVEQGSSAAFRMRDDFVTPVA